MKNAITHFCTRWTESCRGPLAGRTSRRGNGLCPLWGVGLNLLPHSLEAGVGGRESGLSWPADDFLGKITDVQHMTSSRSSAWKAQRGFQEAGLLGFTLKQHWLGVMHLAQSSEFSYMSILIHFLSQVNLLFNFSHINQNLGTCAGQKNV